MGTPRLNLGTILHGRYQIIAVVGQGGFGAVYKAVDLQFGNRLLAIKEMLQDGLSAQEIADAANDFKQEALLLASLKHPSLPSIYDHFTEAGQWYLAMDFIEGETLEAQINRAPRRILGTDEAVRITERLCSVLSYLHNRPQPIIFRDLKPLNIMLTPANHLYLIDFGIARLFKPGQTRDTEAFASMGYAAPEQFGMAQTTARSDIYSLGATLHQMLTGIDPAIQPFQFQPVRSVNPGVSVGLERLVMQMVELDPAKRPASVTTIQQALHNIALGANANQSNAPTQKAPTPSVASKPNTRNSGSAIFGIVLGAVLVLSLCAIGASRVSGLFTPGTTGTSGPGTSTNTFGALVPVGQVVYHTAAPGQCDTQGGNWAQNSYAVQSCETNGLSLAGPDCPCPLGVVALAAIPTQAFPQNYVVQISAQLLSPGSADFFGFKFQQQSQQDDGQGRGGYAFLYALNCQWEFNRYDANGTRHILTMQTMQVSAASANTLDLVVNGSRFSFSMNGNLVSEQSDGTYNQGFLCLVSEPGARVLFKDLTIYSLP